MRTGAATLPHMPPTPDVQAAEAKARELLDNRITSVRALVLARQALDDLRAQVAAAEATDVRAYRAALADGWTAEDLRKLGLDEPAKSQRVQRRAAARRRDPEPSEQSGTTP